MLAPPRERLQGSCRRLSEGRRVIPQQDFEFLEAFYTRRAVVSYSLFALNILIFLLMMLSGGSENPATLLAFGAKYNALIDKGEIWRFVTPIFLHIGLLHLGFNSYALWIVGPQVEKLYGGARFLVLYLLTGVAGVAASYWYHPENESAGASGAIFGLFGVLLVFSIKYRKTVPAFFSRALSKGILMTLAINLAIGWYVPQIDLAAHVGGLVAGCVLAAAIPFARPGESEHAFFKVLQAVSVAIVALSFYQVVTHYDGPGLSMQGLQQRKTSGDFSSSMGQALNAFDNSEMVLESGNLKELPGVEGDLARAIDGLKTVPPLSREADEFRGQLLDLLQKQYGYVKEVESLGAPRSDFLGASPQSVRYRSLKRSYQKWVNDRGGR
jgi:rhomboid protease GluP